MDAFNAAILATWKEILHAYGLLNDTKGAPKLPDAPSGPLDEPRGS